MLALTVQASITLHLIGPPDDAFPLFDPVNETAWDPDWKPRLLGDRVTQGLVFLTNDDRGRAVWLLDRYAPESRILRYVVTSPTLLDQIDISLRPEGSARTIATVTYTRTALDPSADDGVRAFAKHFPQQGPRWEKAINRVLMQRK
jgi:hypothetical protein